MKSILRWLFGFLVLVAGCGAQAITCTSVTSAGFTINYVTNTTTFVQATFSVTCTRAAGDPDTSVTYDVAADNGQNPNGQNNRATLGAATLRYDVYADSACTTQWKGPKRLTNTITWTGGSTGSITQVNSYWGCIVTAQTPTASGIYTDFIQMTLNYPGGTITGNIPVQIVAPAVCTFTTAPGTISIAYTSFGAQQSGSTTFGLQCTNGMPYTIATNVQEGVLVNLRYILSLDSAGGTGSGVPQNYTVTATIPAGQAGTCVGAAACSANQLHSIVVTY